MQVLRVGLLQMRPGPDLASSARTGEEWCRRAAAAGADVALFPEMWSNGYEIFGSDDWTGAAVAVDDPYVLRFRGLARELRMSIVLTLLERVGDGVRNAALVIDRHGEVLTDSAKVHTCSWGPEAACTPGEPAEVVSLDLGDRGAVDVGVMICFDRELPETARMLMLAGAEVILTPNACRLDEVRLTQFRVRAFENAVGVAMANYAHSAEQSARAVSPHTRFNGHSVAYSPIAFDAAEEVVDQTLVEAGEDEGVFLAEFDLAAIRRHRASSVWGARFRRPSAYGALVSEAAGPARP